MIEEEHIRFVAAADVTDDCRVSIELRKARQTLTASQARDLAAELVRSAGEAERAAGELVRESEPASFDVAILSPHEIRQEIPWPPYPDADYMLSRFACACGWSGLAFKDTKSATEQRSYATAQADQHVAGAA